ncbi:PTS mannose/fructose/sorbose/N-acetylgalactosamine transporter subunit IIC [Hominifimenecus sp. rT4P-3]|uniref:PTS mannose/fructose/sorbose/N-acetylgalactosamine transporter subunit IIC n=1 Tax=Hominifimenecus sp. rT4P-3 TaxID=3242979 RepID=UPI003DA25B9C
MTIALAIAGGLCYFLGTCRVGSGTYHSLGSGCFIGFICGLVYGDVTTGLIIGASINLVYLGVVAPAGQIPSDEIMAESVAIPLALAGGMDAETAVALAVPFGLLGVFLDQIRRTSNIYWCHLADKYAEKGDGRGIFMCGTIFPLIVSFCIRFIPVFILLQLGSDAVSNLLAMMPAWLTAGLSVAGGMLPAIGFAIILKTVGNAKLLPYFFIGFFAVQYLGINTMAAAVFGICIALLIFFTSTKGEVGVNG